MLISTFVLDHFLIIFLSCAVVKSDIFVFCNEVKSDKCVVHDSMPVTVSAMKATVVHDVTNVRQDTLAIHTASRVHAARSAASMMTSAFSASVK